MKITQEADYALRIAYKLACEDKVCDAKSIAEDVCISPRFALKILRKFVVGGLAVSYKGVHGGYRLAKSPDQITMRDILELIDGPLDISRCLSDDHTCSRNGTNKELCVFHNIFAKLSSILSDNFDKITFAHLIDSKMTSEEICQLIK
ncbi:MAG: Rrf2 family transcriptional regulator [Clostridiales bacterium]|nr:Rrf2 family transcriptional regulator [Clostridiales bacterium]